MDINCSHTLRVRQAAQAAELAPELAGQLRAGGSLRRRRRREVSGGGTIIAIIMILFSCLAGLSIIFRPGSHFVAIMWRQESPASLLLQVPAFSSPDLRARLFFLSFFCLLFDPSVRPSVLRSQPAGRPTNGRLEGEALALQIVANPRRQPQIRDTSRRGIIMNPPRRNSPVLTRPAREKLYIMTQLPTSSVSSEIGLSFPYRPVATHESLECLSRVASRRRASDAAEAADLGGQVAPLEQCSLANR